MSEKYDNKFTRFLNGKGFYAVLALCLAGAGTAAYIAMETAADKAQKVPQSKAPESSIASEWSFPQSEETARDQQGVKIDSSRPSSSSSEQRSSQKQPQEASEGSASSDVQASWLTPSWSMPTEGEVFTPYSNGELVKSETLGDWRTHNGIDIAVDEGSAVTAPSKGKVSAVTDDPLWGHVVEISHSGGVVTRCCGLNDKVAVKQGDEVKEGQLLGFTGAVPAESSMPPHLHFECLKDGKYIDPLSLID